MKGFCVALVFGLTLAMGAASGDAMTVRYTIMLQSTDAGENAEGEYFVLCEYRPGETPNGKPCGAVPGGGTGTQVGIISHDFFVEFQQDFEVADFYNDILIAFATSFWAGDPDDQCSPRPCTPGDDSALLYNPVVVNNPPPPPPPAQMTPGEKQAYSDFSKQAAVVAAAFGLASGATRGLPQVSATLFAIGSVTGFVAAGFSNLSKDPIDSDYTDIAQPDPWPLPDFGSACAQRVGAYWSNGWGLADAASISFNRMQGAIAAGDSGWTQQQGDAMLGYAADTDNFLAQDKTQVFDCVPEKSVAVAKLDASRVIKFQTYLSNNGPTDSMLQGLASVGITDQGSIDYVTGLMIVQDPNLVVLAFNAMFGAKDQRAAYWQALANNTQ